MQSRRERKERKKKRVNHFARKRDTGREKKQSPCHRAHDPVHTWKHHGFGLSCLGVDHHVLSLPSLSVGVRPEHHGQTLRAGRTEAGGSLEHPEVEHPSLGGHLQKKRALKPPFMSEQDVKFAETIELAAKKPRDPPKQNSLGETF